MITDIEKQEIDLRILSHGLYYTSKLHENVIDSRTKELDNDFDTAESYMDAIKRITRFNDRQFINGVKNLNVEDFEKEIIVQYNFYCRGVRDMANWCIHTTKLMHQTENPYLISAFIEWEKSKVKEIAKQSMMNNKRKIARPMGTFAITSIDIFLGMPHKEMVCEVKGEKWTEYKRINTFDEEQLKALAERKLSQYLLVNKFNTFNLFIESEINQAKSKQEWFNKHTEKEQFYPLEHYIEFLENGFINPSPQPSATIPTIDIIKTPEIEEPTLREIALYYEYLGVQITKDNADEKLKGTTHTSGNKLKQNFDFIHKTINRINIDTDRKNNHRLREFENVITRLKIEGNITAIEKAVSEYNTFKSKLD